MLCRRTFDENVGSCTDHHTEKNSGVAIKRYKFNILSIRRDFMNIEIEMVKQHIISMINGHNYTINGYGTVSLKCVFCTLKSATSHPP